MARDSARQVVTIWLSVLVVLVSPTLAADSPQQPVRNVIVLVMDGTSAGHIAMARWVKGSPLSLDRIPAGVVRTYSSDSLVTDSAAAATAFACGHKTNIGYLGVLPSSTALPFPQAVSEDVKCKPIPSVLEAAKWSGRSVGLVATSEIQHATPAAFSAHCLDRGNFNEIAEQQVYLDMDVVFGGGKVFLLPEGKGGKRTDGENLIEVLKSRGYTFIETREELLKLTSKKAWGSFANEEMVYDIERAKFAPQEPSLAEMTRKAIELLSKNPKGFFLVVEGSEVDWASHEHDPVGVVSELLAYDKAVGEVLAFAEKDGQTLILAFTDHGNGGLSLNNGSYDGLVGPLKKAKITARGLARLLNQDKSEKRIRQLAAQYYSLDNLSPQEVKAIQNAPIKGPGSVLSGRIGIGWGVFGHTGEDVALYAYGPGHPSGLLNNTDIARVCAEHMRIDLRDVERRFFVPVQTLFKDGIEHQLDVKNKTNPVLVLSKGSIRAELPCGQNMVKIGGKTHTFTGRSILAPQTQKVYVPQEAIDLLRAAGF